MVFGNTETEADSSKADECDAPYLASRISKAREVKLMSVVVYPKPSCRTEIG